MNKKFSSVNEDMNELLSDAFFLPYHRACEKAFLIISLINIELSQEMDRDFVHYMKKRIKAPSSIYKKMQSKNLSLDKINDIAGIRVVVHNKKDVYSLLEKILSDKSLNIVKVEDMINAPKDDGYRSIHILTEIDIGEKTANKMKVLCEIQLRSIAEDLWATLSHREIYKDIKLPDKLRQKMYELSDLLNGADSFAETLMELVKEEKEKGEIPKVPRKYSIEIREQIKVTDDVNYYYPSTLSSYFEIMPKESLNQLSKIIEDKKEKKNNKQKHR